VQDSADLTYTQDFTTETGRWVFWVTAVDEDGHESASLEPMLALPFVDGEPASVPAEPLMVTAEPAAGGRVEVGWLYRPDQEYLGPGAAHEARIYWDGGTGTVDYSAPIGTLPMDGPTETDRWSWTSGGLADGTEYRFVVRIATAAHPDGLETQNTDEHTAIADSDVPAAPVLVARVV
jgi:hypothetical protein